MFNIDEAFTGMCPTCHGLFWSQGVLTLNCGLITKVGFPLFCSAKDAASMISTKNVGFGFMTWQRQTTFCMYHSYKTKKHTTFLFKLQKLVSWSTKSYSKKSRWNNCLKLKHIFWFHDYFKHLYDCFRILPLMSPSVFVVLLLFFITHHSLLLLSLCSPPVVSGYLGFIS